MKKQKPVKYLLTATAVVACLAAFPTLAEPPANEPDGQHMDAPPPEAPPGEDAPPPHPHHRPPQNAAENGGVPPSPDDMRGDDGAPRIGSYNGSSTEDTGGALPGTRMGGNDAPPPGGGGVPRITGHDDK